MRWLKNIGLFLLVMFVAWVIALIASRILRRVLNSQMMDFNEMLESFLVKMLRNVIMAIGLIVGLSMLEVEVGPLLAAMGVAGFVLGFALQETLANFAAGLMILIYQPYDLGDFITAGGETGKVVAMNLVSTVLTSPDNQRIIVPNGKIWGGTITNVTGSDTRRVDMTFGIGYDDDVDQARAILEEIVLRARQGAERPGAGHPSPRARGQLGELHRAPVVQDLRLLGGLLGRHPQGEEALRQGRLLDPVPADRRPRARAWTARLPRARRPDDDGDDNGPSNATSMESGSSGGGFDGDG